MSRLAWPEALAALAAPRRGRRVTDEGYAAAVEAFRECFARCTVGVADRLVEQAGALAAAHGLRAADGIHLATALAVMEADSIMALWPAGLG